MNNQLQESSEYVIDEVSISQSNESKYSDNKLRNHKHLIDD